jgi:hypothetical protein
MIYRFAPTLGALLFILCGCANAGIKPSPTADQVVAAQLRARGDRSEISGLEASAITDAYRQQTAKPSQKSPSPLSDNPESGINP